MRTLHLDTGRAWTGGPKQVLYLVKGLLARGHSALLLAPGDSELFHRALLQEVPVKPFSLKGELDFNLLRVVFRLVRQYQPDIVHIHSRRGADVLGALGARFGGASAIILSRRVDDPVTGHLLDRLKFGILCNRIIAVSEAIKSVLVEGGVNPGKIRVVYSAVEDFEVRPEDRLWLRMRLGVPKEAPVIATIGRLIPRKGQRYLLEAVPRVLGYQPEVVFAFFGEGPDELLLKTLAKDLMVEEKVLFAGFEEKIERVLGGLDILVHPVLREGFAGVIREAMVAKVPVVATAVGGTPEMILHGQTGLLVPPADPEALAEAILTLLRNPEYARQLGERGRQYALEKFSVDAMVEGNLAVYYEVLEEVKGFGG